MSTHVRDERNAYGTEISRFQCETCGQEFTVCPKPDQHSQWASCLARECASYDPARDADLLFDDGNVLSMNCRTCRVAVVRSPILKGNDHE